MCFLLISEYNTCKLHKASKDDFTYQALIHARLIYNFSIIWLIEEKNCLMEMVMITSDKEKITIQDYQNSCLRYHKSYRNFLFLAVYICGIYRRIKQPLIMFFNNYLYKDEFPLANTKFRYIQCLSLQLIIFQISFDKHQAPDTVPGFSQRSLKDI